MNRILLIGNSGNRKKSMDGQSVKVRLYKQKLFDEGCEVVYVDLENFQIHIFSILIKIVKEIRKCDRIILITAERGSKFLIPFINRINRKYKKPFVLPLIGIGLLHYSIDMLDDNEKNSFLLEGKYYLGKKKQQFARELSKVDMILAETDTIAKTYKDFYFLENVLTFTNFRESVLAKANNKPISSPLHVVFISRVASIKGIFDLMEVIKGINQDGVIVKLDIYGDLLLNPDEKSLFYKMLDNEICYRGSINNKAVFQTLGLYDLLIFPTRYYGEGIPGILAEALICGVPILSSNFPQSCNILQDGVNSILFEMLSKDDLRSKLLYVCKNKSVISTLREGASLSGTKFTYSYNRRSFLKYVCGFNERIIADKLNS